MEELIFTQAVSTILLLIKKPSIKRKFKNSFIKMRNALTAAFPPELDSK